MVLEQKAAQTPTPAQGRRGRKRGAQHDRTGVAGTTDSAVAHELAGAFDGPGGPASGAADRADGEGTAAQSGMPPAAIPASGRRRPAEPPGRSGLTAKRVVDVAGASAALLLLAPVLLGTATLIRVVDGAPVLFRQPRAGLGGRPFRIYKFRTMRTGADTNRIMS